MAREAIAALGAALPALAAEPGDRAARARALYGAWLCGAALGGTTMALHHKLCHVLGGSFGLPHAETHAVVLPHAAAYNAAAAGDLLAPVTEALGGGGPGAALAGLAARIGAPRALSRARHGRGRSRPGRRPRGGGAVREPAAGRAGRGSAAARRRLGGRAAHRLMASPAARSRSSAPASAGSPRRSRWPGAARGSRSSSRRRRSPRSARASRSRRTGWRCWRRSGSRAAAEPRASPPEAVELRDHRAGPAGGAAAARARRVARRHGRPYWQFHRADLLAVLAAGAAEAGVELRLGTARRSAWSRRPTGFACGPRGGGEHRRRGRDRGRRACARRSARRISPARRPRFTGHVAWRGAGPGGAAAGVLRGAGRRG